MWLTGIFTINTRPTFLWVILNYHITCVSTHFTGNVYKFQTGSRFSAIIWHKNLEEACRSSRPQVGSARTLHSVWVKGQKFSWKWMNEDCQCGGHCVISQQIFVWCDENKASARWQLLQTHRMLQCFHPAICKARPGLVCAVILFCSFHRYQQTSCHSNEGSSQPAGHQECQTCLFGKYRLKREDFDGIY